MISNQRMKGGGRVGSSPPVNSNLMTAAVNNNLMTGLPNSTLMTANGPLMATNPQYYNTFQPEQGMTSLDNKTDSFLFKPLSRYSDRILEKLFSPKYRY